MQVSHDLVSTPVVCFLPVTELSQTLDQIHQKLNELAPLVNRINNLLPAGERLEPYILKPVPEDESDYVHSTGNWSQSSSSSSDENQHRLTGEYEEEDELA